MSARARAGIAVAAAAAVVGALWVWGEGPAVIHLEAGPHGPLTLTERTVVVGEPGAVVEGGIAIRAAGSRVEGVIVEGGEAGISVAGVSGVVLRGVTVRGASLHGIEVSDASARIEGCVVSGLTHEYAQGIEVRNNAGRPRTVIEDCRVTGGREGIVTHASRVEVRDSTIGGTTNRALAITEMSEAVVERNHVHGVVGVALFCGDMSRCEIRGNRVENVAADPSGVRGRSGQGAVVWYHSTARLAGNTFDVAAEPPVDVYYESRTVDGSPLSRWPSGWRGAVPAAPVTAAGLVALAGLTVALRPAVDRLRARGGVRSDHRHRGLARDLLIAVGAVQVFHMAEHGIQVFQVYVREGEERAGLAGARFDTEWLHLGFNAVVFTGMAWGLVLLVRAAPRRHDLAVAVLAAGTTVQAWHVAEHVARVAQHVARGVTPAPGIVGDDLGLVWFHFGINVPVTAALLAAAFLVRPRMRAGARRGAPADQGDFRWPRPRGCSRHAWSSTGPCSRCSREAARSPGWPSPTSPASGWSRTSARPSRSTRSTAAS